GYPDNFHADPTAVEIVNNTQLHCYADSQTRPTAQRLKPEFDAFRQELKKQGVNVFYPTPCSVPDQLTPRDIGFVCGETFFLAQMARASRKLEYEGIGFLLKNMERVVKVPETVVIEGGDIIVDKGVVFVGVSQRTTMDGYRWLAKQLPTFVVIPVPLRSLNDGEDCLHLDCVFVPVGTNHALIYPNGIEGKIPAKLKQYEWLEVTKEEQSQLATNVLSLSKNCVISRHSATRVNKLLEKIGLQVIDLKFDEAPKTGGSFRCCTLPLIRR
ncbi:MAG: arginine deiminase family protein, partial [Patescibacteria group bacterium]